MSESIWEYWRDKYGHLEALKDYYPEILTENEQIKIAVAQIKNAKIVIDHIMKDIIK